MTPRLPVVSGTEAIRAFERLAWRVERRRGSHVCMVKDGMPATLSIPDHDELSIGTLRKLIKLAEVTVDQFAAALKK